MKKIALFLFLLTSSILTFAQTSDEGMALDMRSSGKIYVVIAVILVIFLGLVAYLFSLDRRIRKIEQDAN